MSSRKPPFRRAWRPLLATLALAFAATPLRAQDATQPPPELRADDGASIVTPPTLPSTIDSSPSQDQEKKAKQTKQKGKPVKRAAARLPDLQAYPGAQRAGAHGGPPQFDPALPPPPPTVAALPTPPPKPRKKTDDKPFDPVGVRVGDLRLTPYIEEDLGYSSNPQFVAGATRGSMFETTDVGLGVQSDWATNDLHATLHGGYTDFFAVPQANTPNLAGTVDGRLDVTRDFSLDAEGRFNISTQLPGSVTLPTGVVLAPTQRPLVETYGATIGGVQKFGDLSVSLHGTLDSTNYENANLADGSVDDLSSDNFNDWGLRARVAYQISPIIAPFVESVIDTRRYNDTVDSSGYERSSNGVLGRAGATLALTNQLTGEVSAGYGEREYQDTRLPDLRGPLIDASIIWSATPLTTITFKTGTTLNDTTTAGASGALSRTYSIDVSHALLRNLTLGATASVGTDNYVGVAEHDYLTNFALHADYNVTRDIVLRASASRQQYVSNVPGSNYIANVFMLGLRLQR